MQSAVEQAQAEAAVDAAVRHDDAFIVLVDLDQALAEAAAWLMLQKNSAFS